MMNATMNSILTSEFKIIVCDQFTDDDVCNQVTLVQKSFIERYFDCHIY